MAPGHCDYWILFRFKRNIKGRSIWFIHPTNSCNVPGIVLSARDTAVNRKCILIGSLNPRKEKQTINSVWEVLWKKESRMRGKGLLIWVSCSGKDFSKMTFKPLLKELKELSISGGWALQSQEETGSKCGRPRAAPAEGESDRRWGRSVLAPSLRRSVRPWKPSEEFSSYWNWEAIGRCRAEDGCDLTFILDGLTTCNYQQCPFNIQSWFGLDNKLYGYPNLRRFALALWEIDFRQARMEARRSITLGRRWESSGPEG